METLIKSLLTKLIQEKTELECNLESWLNKPTNINKQHKECIRLLKEIAIIDSGIAKLEKYINIDEK